MNTINAGLRKLGLLREDYQLSLPQQFGWAAGSMGTSIMLGSLMGYALYFMTSYLGIGALLAGQLIGWSKLYDMITDPLMGNISDRTEHSWGRRRPYMMAGAILGPFAIVLMFSIPDFDTTFMTASYIFAILILYATAYTLWNVPYLSMSSEMTTNYDERTLIMSQRFVFSTLGILCLNIVGPFLIAYFSCGQAECEGNTQAGYVGMSWVFAGLVFVSMVSAVYFTRDTKFIERSKHDSYAIKKQLEFVLKNKSFRYYILAKIMMFVAQAFIQGTLLFFSSFILGFERPEMILAYFGIGYTAGALLTIPVWNWLITNRIGKRNAWLISAFALGIITMTWLLAGTNEPALLLYARFFGIGVFAAGIQVAGSAMLPDIMEYDRQRTGINQEGLYAAAFTLVEKVGYTLGPAIVGILLGITGFISTKGGEIVEQPESALFFITLSVSVMPAICNFTGLWLMSHYDLDKSKLEEIAQSK